MSVSPNIVSWDNARVILFSESIQIAHNVRHCSLSLSEMRPAKK